MISGSNRRNGNTQRILELLAESPVRRTALSGQRVEVEMLALGQQQIKTCTGCRACFNQG